MRNKCIAAVLGLVFVACGADGKRPAPATATAEAVTSAQSNQAIAIANAEIEPQANFGAAKKPEAVPFLNQASDIDENTTFVLNKSINFVYYPNMLRVAVDHAFFKNGEQIQVNQLKSEDQEFCHIARFFYEYWKEPHVTPVQIGQARRTLSTNYELVFDDAELRFKFFVSCFMGKNAVLNTHNLKSALGDYIEITQPAQTMPEADPTQP